MVMSVTKLEFVLEENNKTPTLQRTPTLKLHCTGRESTTFISLSAVWALLGSVLWIRIETIRSKIYRKLGSKMLLTRIRILSKPLKTYNNNKIVSTTTGNPLLKLFETTVKENINLSTLTIFRTFCTFL